MMDWVKIKEICVKWCPTKGKVLDFMTTPLQGSHFKRLRDHIMGKVQCVKPNGAEVVTWDGNV